MSNKIRLNIIEANKNSVKDAGSSTENPTEETQQEVTSELLSDKTNEAQKRSIYCHCEPNDPKDIVLEDDVSKKKSCKNCRKCGKTKYVDPWWVINDVTDATKGVREQILTFIKYHNPTKSFSCETSKADHKFEPGPTDRFGIVRSVKCVHCNTEMSLEMNTANNHHKLTVIEKADRPTLKSGDEIVFRRCCGISHHAIFLQKKDAPALEEKNNGCCKSCRKFFRISDDTIEVVSHTFDEEDARIKESDEWLQGGVDVYRVEYDHCYPPEWTQMIAMRAAQFAEYNKLFEKSDSKYDPFLDNCEHFARRCKTGQSESVQVKDRVHNYCLRIAMFVFRAAILGSWWIAVATIKDNDFMGTTTAGLPQTTQYSSPALTYKAKGFVAASWDSWLDETMIKDNEFKETATVDGVPQDPKYIVTGKDLARMEVILSTSLCTLFTLLKVTFSSIYKCRKLRRRQNTKSDNNSSEIIIGRCGTCCSKCCCKYCLCRGVRYLCRMLFCQMPIRLCKQICCTGYCNGCCDVWFCCSQYVIIVLRVFISEVIAIGIPLALFAKLEGYYTFHVFTSNSMILATYGFLFTFPLVLIFSILQSCIANPFGRSIGWCCRRCCYRQKKSDNVSKNIVRSNPV